MSATTTKPSRLAQVAQKIVDADSIDDLNITHDLTTMERKTKYIVVRGSDVRALAEALLKKTRG